MKRIKQVNYLILLSVLTIIASFTACKKNKTVAEPPVVVVPVENTKQTPTTNRIELTNDSIFLYAKEMYYWNTSLPTYDAFEPRKYKTSVTPLVNYEENLFNLVKTSASADYQLSRTYPKYSNIQDFNEQNPDPAGFIPGTKTSVDLEGNGNDLGIRPIIYTLSNTNKTYELYVTAVYEGSSADKEGVKRGWWITKINGTTFGADYVKEQETVYNLLDENSVTLEGFKFVNGKKGDPFTVTLTKTSYKSNPVYISKVLTAGTKKIGYIAYARFSNSTNSVKVLDEAFSKFATENITDLVVDLRYNGGGYISTAEHLINLIAPSSATGTMYKEYYNEHLRNRKQKDATILSNQPLLDANDHIQFEDDKMLTYADIDYSVEGNTTNFEKAGGVTALKNVMFLVSGNTASASELVINSLKPKMTVKLVGETTYGKPIGFFPIRLENRYDVYYSLFETKNSLDQGGYFSGITPDYSETAYNFFDNPRYDFGDKDELYLKQAISVLNPTGATVTGFAKTSTVNKNSAGSGTVLRPLQANTEFVGMIETRHAVNK